MNTLPKRTHKQLLSLCGAIIRMNVPKEKESQIVDCKNKCDDYVDMMITRVDIKSKRV